MSNKGESYAFQSEVLLCLHEAGFTSATRRMEPKGLPLPERVSGDVAGLPVTMAVRNGITLDLSGAVNQARREAAAEGRDVFVSVQRRRGYPVEASFVTTDLATFLLMLRRLHPEIVTT